MRHPSKVGAFCARKMRRGGKLALNELGHGGPPKLSKFRRKGKEQRHPSWDMGPPWDIRLLMRARRDQIRRDKVAEDRARDRP